MRATSSFSDYSPITTIGRLPIHATTILAALYVAAMLAVTILDSAGISLVPFGFFPEGFYQRGWLWQPFTWSFVNGPNFFFLFGIFFFYSAAIEVERYLGRPRFIKLYALTLLAPAVVLGVWKLLGVSGFANGLAVITVAMFIAFATLYPNIEYWGWVPLKYIAFACFAIAALGYFPKHDWPGLTLLLAEAAIGFGFIRFLQRGGSMELGDVWEKVFRRRPKFQVVPSPSRATRSSARSEPVDAIDPLLDKIAKHGLASLTAREHARLEQARAELLKKETR